MPDAPDKNAGATMPTEGFPLAYANLASVIGTFNDIRIYFAELQPKAIATAGAPDQAPVGPSEANIAPRVCVVLTPEFAKSLRDVLSGTVERYEKQFGSLRPVPQAPVPAGPTPAPTPVPKPTRH